LKFESGAVGILLTNWVVGKRIFKVEMHAKGISAFAEPDDKAVIYKDNKEEGEILSTKEVAQSDKEYKYAGFFAENRHFIDCIKKEYKYAGFFAENRHFIDCIKKGNLPLTNFSDAVKTMELVDRIYHSRI